MTGQSRNQCRKRTVKCLRLETFKEKNIGPRSRLVTEKLTRAVFWKETIIFLWPQVAYEQLTSRWNPLEDWIRNQAKTLLYFLIKPRNQAKCPYDTLILISLLYLRISILEFSILDSRISIRISNFSLFTHFSLFLKSEK